jgi:diadenosine tetraphosphate (Ap4A) HIT family hydrolase
MASGEDPTDLRDEIRRKLAQAEHARWLAAPAGTGAMTEAGTGVCRMCQGADPRVTTPLQCLLPEGVSRFIARTPRFVAMPTFGCFVPGYVLVVPRVHVLSFGLLSRQSLAEAGELVERLCERMSAVYQIPVLGFEYGNNVPGGRRVEHAHWHLLPSTADLVGWLDARLTGHAIGGLAGLPGGTEASYIAVRGHRGSMTIYPVPNEASQRIRLRRAVAELDPRVDPGAWDFENARFPDLIRRTARDLAAASLDGGS